MMKRNTLKTYRQEKGLTQAQLAKIANINKVQYQKIEHGKNLPNVNIANRLASALGTKSCLLFPDPLLSQQEIYSNHDSNLVDSTTSKPKEQEICPTCGSLLTI